VRKKVLLTLIVVVVVAVAWIVLYTYPRHINQALTGVEYQTGNANKTLNCVKLQINGTGLAPVDWT
jgi:cell division protein FtsL